MILVKRYSFFLLAFVLFACKKDEGVNGTRLATDPAQYGTANTAVPSANETVIYQVNIRAFSQQGNLAGVTARLDSIKSLGANVVYLMPVYPAGKVRSVNSPYAISNYKEVGEEFGTLEDLRTLVEAAHSKGLSVMLDFVANHTAWDHAWITEHKTWYVRNAAGVIQSPAGYNDVAQLDFANDSVRNALIESLRYWVFTANVDGFRFDFADNVPADFWREANGSLRGINGRKLLLFAEGTRADHFRMGSDLKFGFGFFGGLKAVYGNNEPASNINTVNAAEYASVPEGAAIVRYTSNHDINLSDGTPLELYNGVKGSLGAFVLATYMNGTPMIYNGQEIAWNKRIDYFKKDPINWTSNPAVTEEYKRIIAFRNKSAAVKTGQMFSYSSKDVVAFTKQSGQEKVLVLVNVRNKAVDYVLPAGITKGKWTNVLTNAPITVGDKITLESNAYLVLKPE